jgi:DNA-binding PadR family transcriptional regulator
MLHVNILKRFERGAVSVFHMSEEVTELQKKILALIVNDTHRPAAITKILRNRHVECDQNQVVQALNDLEKRDLVEHTGEKSWTAKESAQEYLD